MSCRAAYVNKAKRWRSRNTETIKIERKMKEAHDKAFQSVVTAIKHKIINGAEVMRLTELRDIYTLHLKDTEFPNDDYRCEKLRKKIEKHKCLAEEVTFLKLEDSTQFQTYLVFSSKITVSQAVEHAY